MFVCCWHLVREDETGAKHPKHSQPSTTKYSTLVVSNVICVLHFTHRPEYRDGKLCEELM